MLGQGSFGPGVEKLANVVIFFVGGFAISKIAKNIQLGVILIVTDLPAKINEPQPHQIGIQHVDLVVLDDLFQVAGEPQIDDLIAFDVDLAGKAAELCKLIELWRHSIAPGKKRAQVKMLFAVLSK